jgi:hypothetical protein
MFPGEPPRDSRTPYESGVHHWPAPTSIKVAWLKPGSLMVVTPTMRSWNEFSAFIEEWDELRKAA